jgi:hypothetical protein
VPFALVAKFDLASPMRTRKEHRRRITRRRR